MKSLILYYSHSGNTEKIATLIHTIMGGEIEAIEPKSVYPQAYNIVVEQAKKEIRQGYLPPLQPIQHDLDVYDILFIGSPNWWGTIAPPVATFLKENDLSGKTVIPFFTHGGGGLSNMEKDMVKLCPQSTVLKSFVVHDSGRMNVKTEIAEWLKGLNLSTEHTGES